MSDNPRHIEKFIAAASKLPAYAWLDKGAFKDADGNDVCPYDDVILLRDVPIEGDTEGPYRIPAGTVATVLFYQAEADGFVDLECCWPADGFSFGWVEKRRVRLHQRAEQKYASAH